MADSGAKAAGWSVDLTLTPFFPPYVFVANKDLQELVIMDGKTEKNPVVRFAATSGRVAGDKIKRGDLKTPEGVYFVVNHIPSGLNFFKYGNEAFTLNYPNPVDILRKKTGSGIWIHGRGEPLVPLQTEGCLSLVNDELESLRSLLTPGTPVLMAQTVDFSPEADMANRVTVTALEEKIRDWAKAWKEKSQSFYSFYNSRDYSVAQREDFSVFRERTDVQFRENEALDISLNDIRILPGPGYQVTWFLEERKIGNTVKTGLRRLYWMPDDADEQKIVGMEWIPNAKNESPPLEIPTLRPLTWDEIAPGLLLDGSNKRVKKRTTSS